MTSNYDMRYLRPKDDARQWWTPTASGYGVSDDFELGAIGETGIVKYNVVYLNPSNGYWYIATNATESTVKSEFGIAWTSPVATATIGDKIIIVRKGMLRYSSWNWSTTGPIYLSTAGGLTQTVPTASGSSVKVVGKPGRLTSVMFFDPEPGWMLLV